MTLQLLGKIQKKSNFIFIFGQMIEDQVLFHLPKFGGNIFSLRNFPDPLKGHDEALYLRGPDLAHSNPSRLMVATEALVHKL